ncbi:MAG TPA: tetratricopeptide repeat protein [Cyanophyceae cyanobacterium]
MSSYNTHKNQNIPQSENQKVSKAHINLARKGFDSSKTSQSIPVSTVQRKPKDFLKSGLEQLNRGNYSSALENFKQALKLDPNLVDAYICQSIIHYYQGNHRGAIADCDEVLRINPNNADVYNNRGLNRIALGDYQEAIADFSHALKIEPHHAKAYLNRGYSRLQLDNNWGAIEDFDQALTIDPQAAKVYLKQVADTLSQEPGAINNPKQKFTKGLLIEGNLRYESGNYQAAIDAYTQIIRLDSKNTEAYNRRSTARSAVGDYEGAFKDLYKAAKYYLDEQSLQPASILTVETRVENYRHRGVNKVQQGDFQGAIEDFNQVLQHNQKDAIALTCRGFARQRLGDNQKAIEDLQQAAKLFAEQGHPKSAQNILHTLKKLQP